MSSSVRSSSSTTPFAGSARSLSEPHLHLPPVKDLTPSVASSIRKQAAGNAAGKSPPPRLTIAKEKKALRGVVKG